MFTDVCQETNNAETEKKRQRQWEKGEEGEQVRAAQSRMSQPHERRPRRGDTLASHSSPPPRDFGINATAALMQVAAHRESQKGAASRRQDTAIRHLFDGSGVAGWPHEKHQVQRLWVQPRIQCAARARPAQNQPRTALWALQSSMRNGSASRI